MYICVIGCVCVGVLSREPIVADNPMGGLNEPWLQGKESREGNDGIPSAMGGVEKITGGGGTNDAGVQFTLMFELAP